MGKADATRELILNAALDEFSTFGVAGARVDRISKNAGCNKNLIYIYFENKETLFNTVLQKYLDRAIDAIPFTADSLPGYAVKVFDFAMTNPKLMRLLMWSNLEYKTVSRLEPSVSHDQKVKEICEAQRLGRVGAAFSPTFLLTTIMTLATAWAETQTFGSAHDPEATKNLDALRDSIAKAVKLMTQTDHPLN